jgi:hypothetical protein
MSLSGSGAVDRREVERPESTGSSTTRFEMAAFMFLFRGDRARGDDSPEQLQRQTQKWLTWFEGLKTAGIYKGQGAPLEPGGRVMRGARKTVSDGPYAEAKDLVGGYAIVEARDLEAAVEIARGCPILEKDGAVEVRPVRAM